MVILTLIGLIRTITSVKKLFNLLESYNLHQHIKNLTHKSGHLLDYIISEKQLINAVSVSDFISDHSAGSARPEVRGTAEPHGGAYPL